MRKNLLITIAISLTMFLFQNCSPLGESNFENVPSSSSLNSSPEVIEEDPQPIIEKSPEIVKPEFNNPQIIQPKVSSISIVNTVDSTDVLNIKNGEEIDSDKLKNKKFKVYATVNSASKLVSFQINEVTNDEVNPPYNSIEFEVKSGSTYSIKVISFEDTEKSGIQSTPFTLKFTTKAESTSPPANENNFSKDYLFFGGFEPNEGSPSSSIFNKFWGINWKNITSSAQITNNSVESYEGQALKIHYPGKTLGRHLRVNFASGFNRLGIPLKEAAYLRYYVKFHKGWDWGISGKIPGLAGNQSRTGGQYVDGTNGWSYRFVWHEGDKYENAHAAAYIYSYGRNGLKKSIKYGYEIKFLDPETKKPMSYPVDEWVCLEQYIKLNDIGKYNGVSKAWMNNKLAVDENKIMYRTVINNNTKVGQMLFSTFFGGGSDAWAPNKDVHASFDNFVISDKRIGCK